MNTYKTLDEQSTWRDAFDAINTTSENLNSVDYLYKSYLGDGQVFNVVGNVGYVNNQEAQRNKNITITSDYIASFKISGFQFYHRKENRVIDIDIDCNLYDYKDNKPHFLYIVLSQHGKYEVYDDMYHNTENLILFARFVINTDGNASQFYVMAPFAGSPDYIKGNTFYEVSEGFDLDYFNKENKQFTITESKVRFSGINFDNYASPDVLHITPGDINIKFKYIYFDTVDSLPRVNWSTNDEVDNLIVNKVMNYSTGALTDVPENSFSNQKIYYDIYSNVFVAMYGKSTYETMEEAIMSVDEILDYPKPDDIDYMLPIAVVTIKNSDEAFSEDTIRIIGLKFDESELFDSNDLARQQSIEAIKKAEQAIDRANEVGTDLSNHIGNKSNPHSVTKSQVGLGSVENYPIATEEQARLAAINTVYMTPLRTLNTIESNSIISDGNITLKINPNEPAKQVGKTIIWIDSDS